MSVPPHPHPYRRQPTADDLVGILFKMYKEDGLAPQDMVTLLNRFPTQTLDFFGAIRCGGGGDGCWC